jgi:hypothetical protein
MQFFSFFLSLFSSRRRQDASATTVYCNSPSITPFDALSWLLLVLALATFIATVHKYALGEEFCNNALIFRAAARHFLNGAPLYQPYPAEHADIFKYSPTFAALLAPLASLPTLWFALAWNALNAGAFVMGALAAARILAERFHVRAFRASAACVLGISAVELLTALQNFQSNALIAGLAMWAFAAMERRKMAQAACLLALSFFVKIYGAAPAALIALYAGDRRRFVATFALALAAFAAAPLFVTTPETLWQEYRAWFDVLRLDYAAANPLSAMNVVSGVLRAAYPAVETSALVALERATQYASLFAQMAPSAFLLALRRVQPSARADDQTATALRSEFRLLAFCSTLIWAVVFNHKAESPTFIIAVAGVALWFVFRSRPVSQRAQRAETLALVAVIVGVSLSATDFFPATTRNLIFTPLRLKVLPCLGLWVYLVFNAFRVARGIAAGVRFPPTMRRQ